MSNPTELSAAADFIPRGFQLHVWLTHTQLQIEELEKRFLELPLQDAPDAQQLATRCEQLAARVRTGVQQMRMIIIALDRELARWRGNQDKVRSAKSLLNRNEAAIHFDQTEAIALGEILQIERERTAVTLVIRRALAILEMSRSSAHGYRR